MKPVTLAIVLQEGAHLATPVHTCAHTGLYRCVQVRTGAYRCVQVCTEVDLQAGDQTGLDYSVPPEVKTRPGGVFKDMLCFTPGYGLMTSLLW